MIKENQLADYYSRAAEYQKVRRLGAIPQPIGKATIKGERKEIEFYDPTKVESEGFIRVYSRDEERRVVVSFITPEEGNVELYENLKL